MRAKAEKNYSGKRFKVQGVAYIEALLALLLFFAIIGGIITMSIAVYRYVLLVHVVTQGVRAVAVDPPSVLQALHDCKEEFNPYITSKMNERLKNLGISTEGKTIGYTSSVAKTVDQDHPGMINCELTVEAKWENAIPCPFCIGFKPGALDLTAKASIPVEDPHWLRCGGCESCG